MRKKYILFAIILLSLSAFLLITRNSGAQEIPSVSYSSLTKNAQNNTPGAPVKLIIPIAKISATVVQVGLEDGKMGTPKRVEDVGWYQFGFRPGEKGNAVIAGHFDDPEGDPAVFWKLGLLRENDDIYVEDTDGRKLRFRVTDIKEYPYDDVPLTTLFTKSLTANLVLITCTGEFDFDTGNYSKRLIVNATMTNSSY